MHCTTSWVKKCKLKPCSLFCSVWGLCSPLWSTLNKNSLVVRCWGFFELPEMKDKHCDCANYSESLYVQIVCLSSLQERSDGKRKMAFPIFARELGWVLCPGYGQAEPIPALITWPWNQKYGGNLLACEVWVTRPMRGSEFKSLLFFRSTAAYKIHSLDIELESKLPVLNKGHKKCELGGSLQNTGRKHPRNSWGMLGQNIVFEDGSCQPRPDLSRDLGYGPPAACSVSPVPEACSHCSCASLSLWIWTVRLNELCTIGSLFTLLNLSKRFLLSLGCGMLRSLG